MGAFSLFDYEQRIWIDSKVANLPFSLRDAARWNHDRITIDKGFREANLWLREAVEALATPSIIKGLDIDARGDDIHELSTRLAAAHLDAYRRIGAPAAIEMAQRKTENEIAGDSTESKVLRITDEKFWRRQIRKSLRIHRELCHLHIAPSKLNYCSSDAENEYSSMIKGHEAWAKSHVFVSDDGREFPAPSPTETAKNRYARLVATTKGLEDEARDKGMIAQIVTITLDSEYHATTTFKNDGKRHANPKYSHLSPKAGHAFLNQRWKAFRKDLGRQQIEVLWVVGAQPHTDETPHWHVVIWCDPIKKEKLNSLFEAHFRTNDNPHQIDYEETRSASGAAAYAMRMLQYITRQVDGEEEEEAKNATAWSSTFGIRRYRTSHSLATMWRLSRNKNINVPSDMKYSAMSGAFYEFKKCVSKYAAKLQYINKKNSYGDSYKLPKGISFVEDEEEKTTFLTASWTIQKLVCDTYSKEPSKSKPAPQNQSQNHSTRAPLYKICKIRQKIIRGRMPPSKSPPIFYRKPPTPPLASRLSRLPMLGMRGASGAGARE